MRARAFNVAVDDLLHFVRIKRFADVIVGTKPESFFRGFERAETGEHDHGKMRINLANLTQPFNSAHARHPNIHDDGVGLFFFKHFEPGLDAIGGVHLIIWFQKHSQALARPHFVINNKDLGQFGPGGHRASAAREARGMPQTRRRSKKNSRKFI